MNSNQEEWVLTSASFAATKRKIDKIAARAVKRGFTGTVELVGEREIRRSTGPGGIPLEEILYRCTITGTAPKHKGWQFLARLETLPADDGTLNWLVNCAPGVSDASIDRATLIEGHCDHCGAVRVNRKKTYLVQNLDTGAITQVGSTCMKDFLGWNTNPIWVDIDALKNTDDVIAGSTDPRTWSPFTVYVAAAAAIEEYGWTPASGEGVPTKERVMTFLNSAEHGGEGERAEGIGARISAVLKSAETDLAEAIERCRHDENGYPANLHAALTASEVPARAIGLVCSAVSYVSRERQREAEKLAKVTEENSKWIGHPGEKIEVTGEVTTRLLVDGYAYNSTQMFIILTTKLGIAKISTAASWAYEVELGEAVTLAATVKKHDVYDGKKQTVLVRPKRIDTPGENTDTPAA